MPSENNSYSVDDVVTARVIGPLFEFVPDDVAVFRANDIGDWQDGYIVASANPDFGIWDIHRSPRITNPEQFDRTRAVWVDDDYLVDWFIEQRLLDDPDDTINRPLTDIDVE